jgi:hypothetical protein
MLTFSRRPLFSLALCLVGYHASAGVSDSTQIPTVTEKTAGMQKLPGYFNLYWDCQARQIEQFEKDPKKMNLTPLAELPMARRSERSTIGMNRSDFHVHPA